MARSPKDPAHGLQAPVARNVARSEVLDTDSADFQKLIGNKGGSSNAVANVSSHVTSHEEEISPAEAEMEYTLRLADTEETLYQSDGRVTYPLLLSHTDAVNGMHAATFRVDGDGAELLVELVNALEPVLGPITDEFTRPARDANGAKVGEGDSLGHLLRFIVRVCVPALRDRAAHGGIDDAEAGRLIGLAEQCRHGTSKVKAAEDAAHAERSRIAAEESVARKKRERLERQATAEVDAAAENERRDKIDDRIAELS